MSDDERHFLLGVVTGPAADDFLPEFDDTVAQVTKSREAVNARLTQLIEARAEINREIKQRRSQDEILRRMERIALTTPEVSDE